MFPIPPPDRLIPRWTAPAKGSPASLAGQLASAVYSLGALGVVIAAGLGAATLAGDSILVFPAAIIGFWASALICRRWPHLCALLATALFTTLAWSIRLRGLDDPDPAPTLFSWL